MTSVDKNLAMKITWRNPAKKKAQPTRVRRVLSGKSYHEYNIFEHQKMDEYRSRKKLYAQIGVEFYDEESVSVLYNQLFERLAVSSIYERYFSPECHLCYRIV